jgi:pyruvate/2-oxoglutarate dehydrogenase complex dihydrolipoamide acyltransferase (E2) component
VRTTIKLPKLSDAGDDAAVLEWLIDTGATVAEGVPLIRVETAKATVDVPSPVAGILEEQLVKVDDDVSTGDPLATIVS